eukprot:scaffold1586_cov116-Isochrysis_galbana.AAC.2
MGRCRKSVDTWAPLSEEPQSRSTTTTPSPPTRWGRGYKGPRRESFPLPDEYSLDANNTPLDQITVKTLTACFSALQDPKQTPPIHSGVGKENAPNH